MKGGTIFLMGGAEIRTGAWMVRGTIVSLKPLRLLPTFSYACAYNPTFLRLYAKHLQSLGFSIPCEARTGAITVTRGMRRSRAKGKSSSGSRTPPAEPHGLANGLLDRRQPPISALPGLAAISPAQPLKFSPH